MTGTRRPRLRRTIEKALLARDRVEIAAAERLLALIETETGGTKTRRKTRAASRRPRHAR